MENASKALIMAAAVLIALMITGALLLMFNNLSNYQETDTQNTRESQIVEFNNQFETYDRNNVRGNELISLTNRIIDYNERKTSDISDEKYEKMVIEIKGIKPENFLYEQNNSILIKTSYNQDNIKSELLNEIQRIEKKYEIKYISKLVSNISNVVDDNNGENKAKEILNKSTIKFNEVKDDTKKYYQYTQFKKAYFNCTNRAYDQNTGRIVSMTFEFVKIGD